MVDQELYDVDEDLVSMTVSIGVSTARAPYDLGILAGDTDRAVCEAVSERRHRPGRTVIGTEGSPWRAAPPAPPVTQFEETSRPADDAPPGAWCNHDDVSWFARPRRNHWGMVMGRILVVDDEPDLIRFVARALEGDGHQVTTALGGVEGMRQAMTEAPDLLILDLVMPDIEGRAVLSGLLAVRPDAQVLVLSAEAGVSARIDVLEAGAVDFLAKPFATRELLARVRCRLARQPYADRGGQSLTVNGLTLDLRARRLTVGDRHVDLSQREFLLMQHLMRRSPQVCSREELLSEVWGYSFDPSTNVVDVCVRRLRHKLQDDQIRTVRNVGYGLQPA